MLILWIKAFHIVFVVAWYAGLLYLPRLFVYHTVVDDSISDLRFQVMEKRLFAIMGIGMAGALFFGAWLWIAGSWTGLWLPAKLALVAGLIVFHLMCGRLMRAFAHHKNHHSQRFYRVFNEIPALILIAIVVLAVVKPF